MAKTIILIFQLKLLQITWSFKKCRRMDSLNIISYLSVAQNAEFLNSLKEGNKGKGSASVDCFARGDSGTFQDQHLFSSEVLSWSLLKPFGYNTTSTPINHIVFVFLQNTSCIRKPQVISGGVRTPCTLPLDPPLAQLVSMMHSAKQGNYLKQPFIASQTLSYTVILS